MALRLQFPSIRRAMEPRASALARLRGAHVLMLLIGGLREPLICASVFPAHLALLGGPDCFGYPPKLS